MSSKNLSPILSKRKSSLTDTFTVASPRLEGGPAAAPILHLLDPDHGAGHIWRFPNMGGTPKSSIYRWVFHGFSMGFP